MNSKEIKDKTIAMRNGTLKLQRDGEYWDDDERSCAQTEFFAGVPINEIALKLGRSETAVYQQIDRMQLFVKTTRGPRRQGSPRTGPGCLCEFCKADRSECPRCIHYHSMKEEA